MTVAELRKVLDLLPDDTIVKVSESTNDGSWSETLATVYTVREAYTSVKRPDTSKPAVIVIG